MSKKPRRIWQVIAVLHTTEAPGEAIRQLTKEGLASRMTVIGGRDALARSLGAAFRQRLVPLDQACPGGPIMVSEGSLSRRLSAPSSEAAVSFAEAIRSFLPASYAADLLKRIGEGALVIWVDASTDEDRQCASRILLRHSRLPVHIHDVLTVDPG